jgi:cytoskeletal protein RodZ
MFLKESTNSLSFVNEIDQKPRHSLDNPPTWLDEWVTRWLDEQLIWADHHKNKAENEENEESTTDKIQSEKQDSPSACSPAETMSDSNLNSSATTSRCETDDRSSIHSSQPEIYDELIMLRQIDNEQKARIHNLTTQLEKLKEHATVK